MKNKSYPIFINYGHSTMKILNATDYIQVSDDDYDQGVMINKKARNVIETMLKTGERISEEDFNNDLLQALSHLNQLAFMAVTAPATEEEKRESVEIKGTGKRNDMKTAKEILHEKATQYNDGFLTGQVKWIVEAMEEYANEVLNESESVFEKELGLAVKEIGRLEDCLQDAEREIKDLNYKL